jgi:uridine kinase
MYLIGIAGGSGSGKSTFAEKIVALVNHDAVLHINQDWYYLPNDEQPRQHFIKGQPNFDHPDAFDWKLMRRQLKELKEGRHVEAPIYDFTTSMRSRETRPVGPCKVAVLEGIYSLWDAQVRGFMDLKVFLEVDADIRFIRRLHRDVRERGRTLDSVINQYYDTVRPMHRQFLEPTSQFADLLVGEETDIAAGVIAEKIRAQLLAG